MTLAELLDVQWSDYSQRHRDKTNLLIHIVAVPLVWLAAVQLVGGMLLLLIGVPGAFKMVFWAAVLIGLAIFAQGRGHAMESVKPEPFTNAKDVAMRLAAEQFVTFPRFVLTGEWLKNLQAAK